MAVPNTTQPATVKADWEKAAPEGVYPAGVVSGFRVWGTIPCATMCGVRWQSALTPVPEPQAGRPNRHRRPPRRRPVVRTAAVSPLGAIDQAVLHGGCGDCTGGDGIQCADQHRCLGG